MSRRRSSTGPDADSRELVMQRAGRRCERCHGRQALQIHHRQPRQMGGTSDPRINDYTNLALLCYTCHRWVESNRTAATNEGWLVPRRKGMPPAQVPWLAVDGWWWPTGKPLAEEPPF